MKRETIGRSLLWVGLLVGVAACAQTPPSAHRAGDWQEHCQQMQRQCQALQAAHTPEERQNLMQEHWQPMHDGQAMLGGCPAAGGQVGMGPGMMGGGAAMGAGMMDPTLGAGPQAGTPTAVQLDRQIQHVEQMLKELKARRASLGK